MPQTTSAVDLSVQQFVGAWLLMCTRTAGHAVERAPGVHYIFGGVPIPFFNVAILTGRGVTADALQAVAESASAWAATRRVPWMLVVTHELLDDGVDATAVLDTCGLMAMMPMTGMIAQRLSPPDRTVSGLQLTVPQDDDGCSKILDVNGMAYGMDLAAGKNLIGTRSFWAGHFPVLGLTDGKLACSATVMMVDGCRYVALVATDPAQQRRGYAEAAMRRALELAADAHGDRPTVLHASEAGRPIYERMGYTPISTHTLFMAKAFLEGH